MSTTLQQADQAHLACRLRACDLLGADAIAFMRATAVCCCDQRHGRYRGCVDQRYFTARGPNGGYLLAIVIKALLEHVDPASTRQLRRLTIQYHHTPSAGELGVRVSLTKAGKLIVQCEATAEQDRRPILKVLATLSTRDLSCSGEKDSVVAPDAGAPPSTDAPSVTLERYRPDGTRWLRVHDRMPPIHHQVKIAPIFGNYFGTPARKGNGGGAGGWVYVPGQRLDEPYVLLLADLWLPASFSLVDGPARAPTIELSVNLRPLPPGGLAPQPVLACHEATACQGGFVEETGALFLANGKPLATFEQSALLLPAG